VYKPANLPPGMRRDAPIAEATLPLGSVGYENATNEKGERLIWLELFLARQLTRSTVFSAQISILDTSANSAAFVRVVENGGFSAAARHLNVSPTMVSNHVQELEDRLGARLLNRTTRKVSLTEIGREYYERSAHILADLDEADRAAGALQATPRGRLRVHWHPSLARFIAPVVTAYLRDNPEVSVDLRRGDQMIDLLEEEIDLAIRPHVPPDSSLMVRRLADWRLVLCCSPSYLETHPEPMSPADLAAHNCIRYPLYPFGDEWRFTDADGKPLTVHVAGNLVTADTKLRRHAAIAGLGVALIAPFKIHEELRAGSVVPLLRNYPAQEFSIAAIFPHRRHLAAKVRVFIDALARLFAGSDWLNPAGAAPPP
jgi:DNA-binding transcriptional LysR family regulator